jgi:hypothetical protein
MVLEDNSVIVNLKSANGRSTVVGRITPADLPTSDWSGSLRWEKKTSSPNLLFPHEISSRVEFTATSHKGTEPPLGPNQASGVTIIISGGDLDETIFVPAYIVSDGVILPREFGDRRAAASINPSNSAVSGIFIHPRSRLRIPFGGVVNSKRHEVEGGFLGTGIGGEVRIVPGFISHGSSHQSN